MQGIVLSAQRNDTPKNKKDGKDRALSKDKNKHRFKEDDKYLYHNHNITPHPISVEGDIL